MEKNHKKDEDGQKQADGMKSTEEILIDYGFFGTISFEIFEPDEPWKIHSILFSYADKV